MSSGGSDEGVRTGGKGGHLLSIWKGGPPNGLNMRYEMKEGVKRSEALESVNRRIRLFSFSPYSKLS